MTATSPVPPMADHYWLTNLHVPVILLEAPVGQSLLSDGLTRINLEIQAGQIRAIQTKPPERADLVAEIPIVDGRNSMAFPCFVDSHTHLDKAHMWPRTPNPDGTFESAMQAVYADALHRRNLEELYQRMAFGLKCSYAHGTQAIRTHLDGGVELLKDSLTVFQSLRQEWADRLQLQAVCLVGLQDYRGEAGEWFADRMAEVGGSLGGFIQMDTDWQSDLDRLFDLAQSRALPLDLHTDESLNPQEQTLRAVAETALRHRFTGPITCGHCCSLSVQEPADLNRTIGLLQEANIQIISLPMCNLYLQDRRVDQTPRLRGVTLIQELHQAGIRVAIASDNCRDPFYGFGDHDMLEVLTMGVRIAHLDNLYPVAPAMVTSSPAAIMGLPHLGHIGVGRPADLVLFRARSYSELLSRPQADRVVLRRGQEIDTTLPDYAELDRWVFKGDA